jgi:hypothetical protein
VRLLFLGDTLFNDGQAYRNMIDESAWRGGCFIGAERLEQAAAFTRIDGDDPHCQPLEQRGRLGGRAQAQGFQLDAAPP